MRQRRPADPTDPGDAADLSIMGYLIWTVRLKSSCRAAVFASGQSRKKPTKSIVS